MNTIKDKVKGYKCKVCKNRFEMSMYVYAQRSMTALKGVCERLNCKTMAAMKVIEKKKLKEGKEWRLRKKKGRLEAKTIAHWKEDLQKVVNWIVKQIDKDHPCISHPEMRSFLRYDAGHYFTVAAHSDIRFNLHNIHKQNSQANERYGGCPEYLLGLQWRHGREYADMVLGLPLKYKGLGKEKFTIANIREIYLPAARALKREMGKGYMPTRDEANELIGIYKNTQDEI